MRKLLLVSLTLLAIFVTQSIIAPPASAQTVAPMHLTLTDAVVPDAPTNVRAVPGDPVAGHYIIVSFTDNSSNETGFEISNGNKNESQGTSPYTGTGTTVVWNWWMPQANSYMCIRVRAYNADNFMSYSAWTPANGWACTTSS